MNVVGLCYKTFNTFCICCIGEPASRYQCSPAYCVWPWCLPQWTSFHICNHQWEWGQRFPHHSSGCPGLHRNAEPPDPRVLPPTGPGETSVSLSESLTLTEAVGVLFSFHCKSEGIDEQSSWGETCSVFPTQARHALQVRWRSRHEKLCRGVDL